MAHSPTYDDKKDDSSTNNSDTDEEFEYERGQHPNSLKAIKKHQFHLCLERKQPHFSQCSPILSHSRIMSLG